MNKYILITGSTGGLGKNICKVFASNKYNLVIVGKDITKLNSLEKQILRYEVSVKKVKVNLLSLNSIEKIYSKTKNLNIAGIINNAAIHNIKSLEKLKDTEIEDLINLNLVIPIKIISRFLNILKKNDESFIANINSIAGINGGNLESIYSASKFGLRGFSESLQYEVTRHNIRLTNYSFGGIQSNMTKNRKDFKKLINPKDAADLIYKNSHQPKSLRVTELNISRTNY